MKTILTLLIVSIGLIFALNQPNAATSNYGDYDNSYIENPDTTKKKEKKTKKKLKEKFKKAKKGLTKAATGETNTDPKSGLTISEEGYEEEEEEK